MICHRDRWLSILSGLVVAPINTIVFTSDVSTMVTAVPNDLATIPIF